MIDALLLGVVVLAALACPLHMLWAHRRGRQAMCCPPRPAEESLEALQARRRDLEARLAELEVTQPEPAEVERPGASGSASRAAASGGRV